MTTITREHLKKLIRAIDSGAYDEEEIIAWVSADEILELARIALESKNDAEPASYEWRYFNHGTGYFGPWVKLNDKGKYEKLKSKYADDNEYEFRVLYSTPPVPVVPVDISGIIERFQYQADHLSDWHHIDEHSCKVNRRDLITAQEFMKSCCATMIQGKADSNLTNDDTKRVDELVMWVKRLAHSLRKANPDSKLQSDAMDYLSRNGLIRVEDVLR